MNILLYTSNSVYGKERFGGAEVSINLIGKELAVLGHNVTYVTLGVDNFEYLKVGENFNVIKIKAKRFSFLNRILNKIFFKKGKKNYFFLYLLNKILRDKKIDLVYMSYELMMLEHFICLKKRRRFKIVMRMAGLKWVDQIKQESKYRKRYSYVFNHVDGINYNTPGLKSLSHEGSQSVNLFFKPNYEFICDIGSTFNADLYREKKQIKRDRFKIIVATRFSTYQKRQDLLVEAIKILNDRIPVSVLMIGDGPNRSYIQNMIDEAKLSDRVRIIPFLKQEELWDNLREYDLLCHPCEYEGLSKIIIEAMSIKIPVLASNVSPLNDYITSEVNGYLVENKAEVWSKKILDIYNLEKTEIDAICERAYKDINEKYDPKNNVKEYEKEFLTIIGNK